MQVEDWRHSEYTLLSERINLTVAQRRRTEEQTLIAVAVFYGWTFSQAGTLGEILFRVSLLFPGFMLLMGILRWFGLQSQIVLLKGRLLEIENSLDIDALGWEKYVEKRRASNPILGWGEALSETFSWAFFGFSCLLLCIYLWDKYSLIADFTK